MSGSVGGVAASLNCVGRQGGLTESFSLHSVDMPDLDSSLPHPGVMVVTLRAHNNNRLIHNRNNDR